MVYYYNDSQDKKNPDDCNIFNCSYKNLIELPKLPNSLTELYCSHNNLTELPGLPNLLLVLHCYNNKLIELPELPMTLKELMCENNNIKYLSPNNCEVMKNGCELSVLNNPFSAGFIWDEDFQEYLMNF